MSMKYRKYNNSWHYFVIGALFLFLFGGMRVIQQLITTLVSSWVTVALTIGVTILALRVMKTARFNQHMQGVVSGFSQDKTKFVEQAVRVLAQAVMADGKLGERERQTALQFFEFNLGYTGDRLLWVKDLFTHALAHPVSFEELTSEINTTESQEAKLILLHVVYRIVLADGIRSASEEAFIQKLVAALRLSEAEHAHTRAMFIPDKHSISDDYAILGLAEGASQDETKKAYRALCKEHHPDKVHHLGPEFQKIAEEKMQKINQAYKNLMS